MVLSRKRRQKLRAELNNPETNPETPQKSSIVDKSENVTGKKRKRGSKIEALLQKIRENNKIEVGFVNGEEKVESLNDNDKINEKLKGEFGDEEKVVSLNSNGKKKNKKKKKKKVKKKKVEVEELEKVEIGVENGGIEEQIVEENGEGKNGGISDQIVHENSKKDDGDAKKVYVGGMPYYCTEDDIRNYFGYYGAITEIDCMNFPETGKFRGIAIITFETEEAAENALELDGCDMDGLYMTIQPYKTNRPRPTKTSNFSPPVIEGYNRIYAGNLSWDITEDDLRKFFSDCKISAIRFGEEKETGIFKGYAHVDFADDVSLNKALKLDQKLVCGRPMKISRAVPRKGAVTNGVPTQTAVKPEINSGVNSVVKPEINSEVNSVVKPEINSEVNSVAKPEINNGVISNVTPENNSVVKEIVPLQPENKTGVSSGKLKRRTCYDCGERGHISSDCPKKQNS